MLKFAQFANISQSLSYKKPLFNPEFAFRENRLCALKVSSTEITQKRALYCFLICPPGAL